jgi:triphosphoribosyl-dephospho-CoA synthase
MVAAAGANTHKGYIFLAGLVLLAAATGGARNLQTAIASLARRILAPAGRDEAAGASHGALARAAHGVGGIHAEALGGLPSVFGCGLAVLAAGEPDSPETQHRLMAALMQAVEDTTAVHRGGLPGLARLRADGERLARLIDDRAEYLPSLASLNDDYRRLNLTMGGVADCMALSFALHGWLDGVPGGARGGSAGPDAEL